MLRTMLKSKIHGATVTQTELFYAGSITIDQDLMDAVDILENELVQIVNLNNGSRIETYVIAGERGSGVICLNGPAARTAAVGDTGHVLCYAQMTDEEARQVHPQIAVLGSDNRIAESK
jgi:aspartate 1-decarboxylase